MASHLPPEGTAPAPAEHAAPQRALTHVAQAHPNNLVDPWWINEMELRGYGEILYKDWPFAHDDVTPAFVDEHTPDGTTIVRRASLVRSRRVECVFETEGALASTDIRGGRLWVGVAARDLASAEHLLAAIEDAFPRPPEDAEDEDATPHISVSLWSRADESRGNRKLDVAPWPDIEANYAPATLGAIAPLMEPDFRPDRGQLLVWYGPPGTGKSYALSALAYAWREWAAFSYIADPEALLGDTSYLLEWMTLRHPQDRWRVAILEDTGELFGADAGKRTGQGLARLLNATDGMLGKGSRTLFVITTNEPISRFHQAVVRPGRCVSRVEFEAMPIEQAKAWLLERGAAEQAKRLTGPATVAELFAMAAGDYEPPAPSATGMYL